MTFSVKGLFVIFIINDAQHNQTLYGFIVTLNVIKLNAITLCHDTNCHYAECRYVKCHAECRFVKCHAECHCAQCRSVECHCAIFITFVLSKVLSLMSRRSGLFFIKHIVLSLHTCHFHSYGLFTRPIAQHHAISKDTRLCTCLTKSLM